MDAERFCLRIGSRRIEAGERETLEVRNPATAEFIGSLPIATMADLDEALVTSEAAFRAWKTTTAYERARILKKTADLMRDNLEELARRLTREQGKAIAESRIEFAGAADTFEWFAEEGRRAYGRIVPARERNQRWLVTREPVGPVAAFSPWNFPAMLSARKIAGALAAGCSCIIKPAEETPSPALAFADLLEKAGLPDGVLNVVFGVPADISKHLIASPIIRKISFTGSIPVGKQLARLAADGLKKGTFELGGHSPVLVFDDADIEQAVAISLKFKSRNAGQMCISPTRFYVQEGVHDRFVDAFSAAASALSVGDGMDESNDMGSLANPRRIDAMERLVADAREHGARLKAGGRRIGNGGYFWEPTVLCDVPEEAAAMNEEPFGPMALINRFTGFDDAIEKANRLPYGLSAYAFTTSHRTAAAVGDALEAGVVGINNTMVSVAEAPFGGIKDSGYGSEAGAEGLEAFQNTKFISQM